MIDLTEQQIADARNNDLTAVTAVVAATDERVVQLARRYATTGGWTDEDLAEDLAQTGREAVWLGLSRFKGTTVAQFFTFVDRTLNGAMSDDRKEVTRQGVSRSAANDFERALSMAGGDPYEAERLVCTAEAMGARRMSPEMAYAARMAWLGALSVDALIHGDEGDNPGDYVTLGDRIESTIGIPEDLMTTADVETARQRTVRRMVHATLDKLNDRMAGVLRRDYGIGDVPYYGDEVATADAEMAADMGLTAAQVQKSRFDGRARFAVLYLKGASA